jgi:multiple sugar transport system permease protein
MRAGIKLTPQSASEDAVRSLPRRRRRTAWTPYLCLLPATVLLLTFVLVPMLSVFYYSLQVYNPTAPYLDRFAGLDNFRQIFAHDPLFWHSLVVTAKWVIAEVVLQFILGMGLALILNRISRFSGLVRAVVFSPWAVSGVAVTSIWALMYNPFGGIFNTVLRDTGLSPHGVQWLADTHTVFGAVVTAELWRGVPFFAILLLAALQAIPDELNEAARVDGAGRITLFTRITLPLLRDAIVISTLLRAVWEFKDVDVIFTMTGGGPANQTTTLPLYIANQAIKNHNFGYGSALTVVGFVILVVFAVSYLKISRFGQDR